MPGGLVVRHSLGVENEVRGSIQTQTTLAPWKPQVYQAILERRPGPIIPRLKEILDESDPALGYFNGDLRFWLGWAQEIAGDHAAAQKSWQQARSELESFLKEQPENFNVLSDLALALRQIPPSTIRR